MAWNPTLNIDTDSRDGMINYSALASAVILKAYEDLIGPQLNSKWMKDFKRRERWREDAREFLTKANEDLGIWCNLGGLNMTAIVEQTNRKLEELRINPQEGQ